MNATNLNNAKSIILFDGYCNLCNSAMQFVIKRDKKKSFRFISIQSEIGSNLMKENQLPMEDINTLILIENGQVFTKSTGALKIAKSLSGFWPICSVFRLVPKIGRDKIYQWVAKNRYQWFGKKEQCILIPHENQDFEIEH